MLFREQVITLSLIIYTSLAGAQNIPLDEAVTTGKLANGLTYYIRKNMEPQKRVTLYLVNKVGSILETDKQRGLAHFMEHMSFNGTKNFPGNTLINELQKAGVRFGADLNAYTGFDETVYQLPISSADPKTVMSGLAILRDWAQEAELNQEEIDKERGVVLEEKRLGKGAQERISRITLPVLVNHSRYAERLPIGTEEVIKSFTRKDLLDYYQNWYRPDLQAIIIVGDIDVKEMEMAIEKLFSTLKMPTQPKKRTAYTVPLTGKNQFVTATDVEVAQTSAQILIKHKSVVANNKEGYLQLVRRQIFNQLIGSRFGELSQQPQLPYLQAGASIDKLLGGLDAFSINIVAKPGQLEKAVKAVWTEIERIRQFAFTTTELERAKVNYLTQIESTLKDKEKISSDQLVKEYVRHFIDGEVSPGIEKEYALTKEYLSHLTVGEINKMAVEYITDVNRDIIIQAPEKDKTNLPDEGSFSSWILSAKKTPITAYVDEVKQGEFLASLPEPGKIVSEKKLVDLDITELTLSNGIKVLLKPTTFKKDEIVFNAFSPGGTSLYNDADYESAASAGGIVSASGIGEFSMKDLPKLLNGKNAQVMPYIAERGEGITGGAAPKDAETAMQLIHLYFTAPRKDQDVFNKIIDRSKLSIANRYTSPRSVFSDTISAVLSNYAKRKSAPTLEKLNSIGLDKVFAIYKERFADPADFIFVFTGAFDSVSMRSLLEKYIGSLPAKDNNEKPVDRGIRIAPGMITKTVKKGSEEQATVQLVLSGNYVFDQSNNLSLNAISKILQYRITERLREKEGGAYSPSVRLGYQKFPESSYAFTISFGCAPGNVTSLIAAAKEEVSNLQSHGALAPELEKFVAEEKVQLPMRLQTNQFWNGYIISQLENGEQLNNILKYDGLLQKLTLTEVNDFAKQVLGTKNVLEFILLPE